jgi:hypothetical protein
MPRVTAAAARPPLAWFIVVAGCGGRASEPRAIPTDASSSAAYEGGSAVDVITQTEASLDVATSCAGAQDCMALSLVSNSVYCCMDNACVADQPGYCTDANVQLIQASSYDQSCKTDADCVAVSEGNACDLLPFCPNATISRAALAQYQSDLAKTRLASCSSPWLASCTPYIFCCQDGACLWGSQCLPAPAAADATPGSDASDGGGGGPEGSDPSSSAGDYSLLNCPGGLVFPPACSSCNTASASLTTACAGCIALCAPADASAD